MAEVPNVPDTTLLPIGSVQRTELGRDATEPMREDIRLLGAILGDTVREQNGDAVFDLVERARVESFRVRRSEIDRAELAALFAGIDLGAQHVLGQRRPVVRQMNLIADQRDRPGVLGLAQLLGGARGGQTATDYDDASVCSHGAFLHDAAGAR